MIPVAGKGRAVAALALGDLIFVVREKEVHAACVQVDGLAEERFAHGAALDVPAGSAAAPRTIPGVGAVVGFVSFPESEVADVFLFVGIGGCDFAGEGGADLELAFFNAGEPTVVFEGGDFEIHRAVGCAVSVTFAHEHVDHVDLLADVAGGGGFDVGWEAVQRGTIRVKFVGPLLGDVGQGATFFAGTADGFVVNVGEVADVFYFIGAELELEEAADHVVDDESAEVADVRRGVNRGAAIIEADDAVGLRRSDRFEAALERIVKLDGHEQRMRKGD